MPQQHPPPQHAPSVPIDGLQLRVIDLSQSLARLEAQRPVLEQQMRSNNQGLREHAERQLFDVNLQIASSQAEISALRELIAQQGGTAPTETFTYASQPDRSFFQRIDDDAITAMFVMTTMAIILPLSIAITRRLWRRPPAPLPSAPLDDMAKRMERLEQAVDAVAIEIERVSESQRFVARVLVERPAPPPQVAVDADAASALGEGKPFLALGAGPMEPIPVAQRQAVKQSVTPH